MKRNNLIFYGIPNEAREKEHALIGKVTFLDEDRECKVKMTSCQSEYFIKRPEGLVKIVDLDNASPGKGVDPPEHENPEGGGDHHRKQDVRSLRLSVFISLQLCSFNIFPRYTGPEVFGCRPVLVVFEDFKDREEVLQNSKLVTMLGLVMMVMSQVQQKHRGLCH